MKYSKGPNKQGIQTRGNEVNTKNQVIQGVRSSMSCYILSELAFKGTGGVQPFLGVKKQVRLILK